MSVREELDKVVADHKKEVERLETRRAEDLGNSVNYLENEFQIEGEKGYIEGVNEAICELDGAELVANLDKLVADNKKELDRLADRRADELGNSINFAENEFQIAHTQGYIAGLEKAHCLVK